MIRYHLHHNNYLEVARAYRAIFDTLPHMAEDFVPLDPAGVVLKKVCWFAVLAPRHTDEQVRTGLALCPQHFAILGVHQQLNVFAACQKHGLPAFCLPTMRFAVIHPVKVYYI